MKPIVKDLCFEIVQKCPNNCLFCSSNSNMAKSCFIPFDIFKNTILHILAQAEIKEISLSGGEPLLHPQLHQMIALCSDLGIKTTLYTSGIVLRKDIQRSENPYIQKMINQLGAFDSISQNEFKELERIGLKKVVFDLQAAEVDEYNSLMGTKNNFSHLLKSILHASYCNFEKSIHFIPNKINIHQFKDVLELTELAGISELRILRFVPQGRRRENRKNLELNNEELISFLTDVQKIKSQTTKIKIGIPLTKENQHLCAAGNDKLLIRFDGQILPCPAFKDIEISTLQKNGFDTINVYKNLTDLKVNSGTNENPLCQKFDRFK